MARYVVYNPANLVQRAVIAGIDIEPGMTRGPFELSDSEVLGLRAQRLQVTPYGAYVGIVDNDDGDGSAAPSGGNGDYGYAQYGASPAATINLSPGVRTQLSFDLMQAGARVMDRLYPPFVGHGFWDGYSVRARASGDAAHIRFAADALASAASGHIKIELDIGGGTPTVLETKPYFLMNPAGEGGERLSVLFTDFMRDTFKRNGGSLYLTASVSCTLTLMTLVIFPITAVRNG